MNRKYWLTLTGLLVATPGVLLAEPTVERWATSQVQEAFVKPLERHRSKRFSRGRRPPAERRVRIVSATVIEDRAGGRYVPFAVDARYEAEWQDEFTGCVYRGSNKVFVRTGSSYVPAEYYSGKKAASVEGVCQPASDGPPEAATPRARSQLSGSY